MKGGKGQDQQWGEGVSSGSLMKHMITRSGILFLVKLLGIVARIPLIRILGPEGIGLYQMAYAFYGFSLTVISGGLPTSLALTTAEDLSLGRRLFKRLAVLLLILGLGAGWFCYRFSDSLARSLGNDQLAFPIRCVAPAIVIVPLLGLVRGYLQGRNSHGSIAISELVEQTVRLTFMILLVFAWLPLGLSHAIGGAMIGAFAGAVGAVVFLLASTRVFAFVESGKLPEMPGIKAQREIALFLYSSLTVSATRYIVPLSDFLDAYIVPNRLQASGYSLSEAVSIFGELAGMGALVVYMPTLITSALAYTLSTKLVADRIALRHHTFRVRSEFALRFSWLWGCASAWFLYTYAEPLSSLFFYNSSAANAIRYMAFIPILAGLREVTTIILWSGGDKIRPLQGLVLAIIGSVLCNYMLIAIPGFGYAGAVIGILSLELIAALWNSIMLTKAHRITVPPIQTLIETTQLLVCLIIVHYSIHTLGAWFGSGRLWEIIQMAIVYCAGVCYLVIKVREIRKQI